MAQDILIVDDEADIRTMLAGILEDEGYETREAGDGEGALEGVRGRCPTLVILDIWLQGSRIDGLAVLDTIKHEHPSLPVLMISGHGTIETAVQAIKQGAFDFIEKPFQTDRLIVLVERAIEDARLRRENAELRLRMGAPDALVGDSTHMNQVRQAVERVAPTGSRAMIFGPPGVGKETVARLLHTHSRRADGPFVVLNCAAMHPERMESELFGEEPATPGVSGPRKTGTFEQAHGGTLFLDEVGDMPLETQGKIVRVLQEQSFHRVGGRVQVQVDVRVVAATSHDLPEAINNGTFREDLYYRVNVMDIHLPPLRERPGDILPLARHFIKKHSARATHPIEGISDEAAKLLTRYHWPGNVRELENTIEKAVLLCKNQRLEPEDLDMNISETETDLLPANDNLSLKEALKEVERKIILRTLDECDGNKKQTAERLDINRTTLYNKLHEHEIMES